MRTRIAPIAALILGLTAFGAAQAISATAAPAADCSQGSAEEKVACLDKKVDGPQQSERVCHTASAV
jgi:hypothetical protein